MRRRLTYVVLAALMLLAAGASSTFAARGNVQTFVFNGRLLADAGSSTSLYVDVNGGNRPALKKLVGQSDNQTIRPGTGFAAISFCAHGS